MTIRAILYDNDGTLVDTHDLILSSMRHATLNVLGKALPDDVLMKGVGTPLATQMLELADGDEALCEELLFVYREHNHAAHDAAISLFEGVSEGLRRLQEAGFAQGVVTAKRRPLAQHGLEITGVWGYFDCIVGADECENHKPAPDPIIMGAQMLGLQPEECIYLGDSPYDMQAGLAAGCQTVAALWGMFPAEELLACGPSWSCASFRAFADRVLSSSL